MIEYSSEAFSPKNGAETDKGLSISDVIRAAREGQANYTPVNGAVAETIELSDNLTLLLTSESSPEELDLVACLGDEVRKLLAKDGVKDGAYISVSGETVVYASSASGFVPIRIGGESTLIGEITDVGAAYLPADWTSLDAKQGTTAEREALNFIQPGVPCIRLQNTQDMLDGIVPKGDLANIVVPLYSPTKISTIEILKNQEYSSLAEKLARQDEANLRLIQLLAQKGEYYLARLEVDSHKMATSTTEIQEGLEKIINGGRKNFRVDCIAAVRPKGVSLQGDNLDLRAMTGVIYQGVDVITIGNRRCFALRISDLEKDEIVEVLPGDLFSFSPYRT